MKNNDDWFLKILEIQNKAVKNPETMTSMDEYCEEMDRKDEEESEGEAADFKDCRHVVK